MLKAWIVLSFVLIVSVSSFASQNSDEELLSRCQSQALEIANGIDKALFSYPRNYVIETVLVEDTNYSGGKKFTFDITQTSNVTAGGTHTLTEGHRVVLEKRYATNFCEKLISLEEISK